jgi:hypothetical protein
MNEQTNIFLRVLQIGVDRQGETICFDELILFIKNEFKVSDDMTPIVRRWFYDYFYLPETFRRNQGVTSSSMTDYELRKHDTKKAYFTGDGYFRYYEYLEVKRAYDNAQIAIENAKESAKLAGTSLNWVIFSLVVASLIGLAQIGLMVYQSWTSP